MNIYVGNLPYTLSSGDLGELFEQYGSVLRANVITDRDTGESKGFGFVEMANAEDGEKAIEGLHDSSVQGRNIKVNEARPRDDGGRRGGGGGGGGGGKWRKN